MGALKRGKKREAAPAAETRPAEVQLRNGERHPFGMLGEYVPLRHGEARLYRAVREAVPVVDAAIYKLIRMTGGVTVSPNCPRPAGTVRKNSPSSRSARRSSQRTASPPVMRISL